MATFPAHFRLAPETDEGGPDQNRELQACLRPLVEDGLICRGQFALYVLPGAAAHPAAAEFRAISSEADFQPRIVPLVGYGARKFLGYNLYPSHPPHLPLGAISPTKMVFRPGETVTGANA